MKKKYGNKIREAVYQQELKPVYRSIFINKIQNILYEAIDQTREETIREVEAEMKNIYNDEEGRGNWEYTIGYKERNNEVLDILNKLKK